MLRRFLIVCSQVCLPLALSAQRPDTTMVPRELAQVLLGFQSWEAEWPKIVVGRLPSEQLARFIPAGARVVGGVAYPAGGMFPLGSSSVVFALSQPLASATETVRSHLLKAGLRLAPPMPSEGPGGFAASFPDENTMTQFCGDSIAVNARTMGAVDDGTYAAVSLKRGIRHTLCDPSIRSRAFSETEEIPVPRLALPAGAKGRGSGGSSSNGSRDLNATIVSAMSAREVVAHYATQMQQGGWIAGRILTETGTAITTLRRTDEKGEEYLAALSDVIPSANRHEITLRLWNKKSPYPEEE